MPDPYTTIYARICTLLEGRAAWRALIAVNNFHQYDDDTAAVRAKAEQNRRIAANFMEASLKEAGFSAAPQSVPVRAQTTFCQTTTALLPAQTTTVYELKILSKDLRIDKINEARYESEQALIGGGQTLGVSGVRSWTITGSTRMAEDDETKKKWRWMLVMNISVVYRAA